MTAAHPLRLGIRPATVLIDDAAQEWMGPGFAFGLQQELACADAIVASFAQDESAAYLNRADALLETRVELRRGQLSVRSEMFDLVSGKITEHWDATGAGLDGYLSALSQIADHLAPGKAVPLGTRNLAAYRAFTAAALTGDRGQRAQLLQQAAQADPGFGLAWTSWAETAGPEVLKVAPGPASFSPFDRLRWQAVRSRLQNEPRTEQRRAVDALLRMSPNNIEALAQLAALDVSSGDTKRGEVLLRRAAELNPANLALQLRLNALRAK